MHSLYNLFPHHVSGQGPDLPLDAGIHSVRHDSGLLSRSRAHERRLLCSPFTLCPLRRSAPSELHSLARRGTPTRSSLAAPLLSALEPDSPTPDALSRLSNAIAVALRAVNARVCVRTENGIFESSREGGIFRRKTQGMYTSKIQFMRPLSPPFAST